MLQEAVVDSPHRLEEAGVALAPGVMLQLEQPLIVHQVRERHDLDVVDRGPDLVAACDLSLFPGLADFNDVADLEVSPLETPANREVDSPGLVLVRYLNRLSIVYIVLKQ